MAQIDNDINLIIKKLNVLAEKYRGEIRSKTVLRKASKVVLNKLKDNTPEDTKGLKASMKFLTLRSKTGVFIGPDLKDKPIPLAHILEYGRITKNGKRIEGNPFIFKSYEQTKGQVLVNLTNELKLLHDKFEKQL